MENIRRHGQSRFALDGVGTIRPTTQTDAADTDLEVTFHLSQTEQGDIFLGLIAEPGLHLDDNPFTLFGAAAGGINVDVSDVMFLDTSWTMSQRASFSSATAVARRARITQGIQPKVDHETHWEATIPLVNWRSEQDYSLQLDDLSFDIHKVDDNKMQTRLLQRTGGVRHTHNLTISAISTEERIEEYVEIVELALSLTSGGLVSHLEVQLGQSGTSKVRILRDPILRPRSRHLFGNFGLIDATALAGLMLKQPLTTVRTYVHAYAEACNQDLFIEARALNSVALIEMLIRDEAGPDDSMDRDLRKNIEAAAKSGAGDAIDKMELDSALADRTHRVITNRLNGLFDSSFAERLEAAVRRSNVLTADDTERSSVLRFIRDTRNELVHRYRLTGTPKERLDATSQLQWICLALIARNLGYTNGFESYRDTHFSF